MDNNTEQWSKINHLQQEKNAVCSSMCINVQECMIRSRMGWLVVKYHLYTVSQVSSELDQDWNHSSSL